MFWRSIYVRFFLITICSMLLVVGGLSYISFRSTRALITRHVTESLTKQADSLARELATLGDGYSTAARLFGGAVKDQKPKAWAQAAQRLLGVGRDVLAFAVLRASPDGKVVLVYRAEAPGFVTDVRYGVNGIAAIRELLLKKERAVIPSLEAERVASTRHGLSGRYLSALVTDLAPAILLTASLLGEPAANGDLDWAIVSMWSGFGAGLAADEVHGYLVTEQGKILLAPTGKSAAVRAKDVSSLVTAAVAARDRAGSKWIESGGAPASVVAFASVPKTRLYVVLEKHGDLSRMGADSSLIDLGLWSWAGLLACVMLSYLGAAGIARNLTEVAEATRRIAAGDLAYRYTPRGQDEVSWLGRAVNEMATDLQRLLVEQQQKARIDAELGAAQILQNALLPPTFSAPQGVRIAGRVESASECGGDWWGRFELPHDLELLCIADVTGHGVSASLVTGMICSFITSVAFQARKNPDMAVSPAAILNDVNQLLYEVGRGRLTATALIATVNRRTGDVLLANGGHNPPLLLEQHAPGGETRISNSKCRVIVGGANMLGLMPDEIACKEKRASLGPGDKLVFYTDGLIERLARSVHGTGLRDLRALMHKHRTLDAQGLLRIVIDRAMSSGGDVLLDDVTLVVLEFLGTRGERKGAA